MPASLSDDLLERLEGDAMQRITAALGLSHDLATQAVATTLPLLFTALGRSARRPGGAAALGDMIERAPCGRDPEAALSQALDGDGAGERIVGRLLGTHTSATMDHIARATAVDDGRAAQLLWMLAPVVMAYVAERASAGGEGGEPVADDVTGALVHEARRLRTRDAHVDTLFARFDEQDGLQPVDLSTDPNLQSSPLPVETAEMRNPRAQL